MPAEGRAGWELRRNPYVSLTQPVTPFRRFHAGTQAHHPPLHGASESTRSSTFPFLRLVWQTHRGYTISIAVLRLLRSFFPVGALWVGKLIIDTVLAIRGGRRARHGSGACSA